MALLSFKPGTGDDVIVSGTIRSISTGGLFVTSSMPLKFNVGDRFDIAFTLPGSTTHIQCECEVVWCREYTPTGKLEPGFGVRFIDLPYIFQETIKSWTRTNWQ